MPAIALPGLSGLDIHFEDTVAALFAASGYVVQRRLRMRDPDELLELDTVATDYRSDPPRTIVIECKAGRRWGWNDIFHLLGRMRFLGITEGAVFARQLPGGRTLAGLNKHTAPHQIQCLLLDDDARVVDSFTNAGYAAEVRPDRFEIWRYAFALERAVVSFVEKQKKIADTSSNLRAAVALARYYEAINSKIFFQPNLYDRLQRLYSLWQESPRLALGCALEIQGKPFDPNAQDSSNTVIREALYEGKHDLVQAAMFIEHRARLAVLKAVVDLIIAGTTPRPIILVKGAPVFTEWHFLPSNVREGLGELQDSATFRQLAVLWQQFLWTFGGFILEDRRAKELRALAKASGTSKAAANAGLRAFDLLFPLPNSWHWKANNSQCRLVRMVPTPFQGLGAYYRKVLYKKERFEEFQFPDYTGQDLAKWNNVGYRWLSSHGDLPMED